MTTRPNVPAALKREVLTEAAFAVPLLVSLNASFDRESVSNLLFLRVADGRNDLLIGGDGMLRFTSLIAAGCADYRLVTNNANQLYSYTVSLTDKGRMLLVAWVSGDRSRVVELLGGGLPGTDGD